MNKLMILPLAAATAMVAGCASTGGYGGGYDDGGLRRFTGVISLRPMLLGEAE